MNRIKLHTCNKTDYCVKPVCVQVEMIHSGICPQIPLCFQPFPSFKRISWFCFCFCKDVFLESERSLFNLVTSGMLGMLVAAATARSGWLEDNRGWCNQPKHQINTSTWLVCCKNLLDGFMIACLTFLSYSSFNGCQWEEKKVFIMCCKCWFSRSQVSLRTCLCELFTETSSSIWTHMLLLSCSGGIFHHYDPQDQAAEHPSISGAVIRTQNGSQQNIGVDLCTVGAGNTTPIKHPLTDFRPASS